MKPEDPVMERLLFLRNATENIRAREDLTIRIMAQIQAEFSWYEALLGPAWRLFPLAFAIVMMTCAFAYQTQQDAVSSSVWAEEPASVVWE